MSLTTYSASAFRPMAISIHSPTCAPAPVPTPPAMPPIRAAPPVVVSMTMRHWRSTSTMSFTTPWRFRSRKLRRIQQTASPSESLMACRTLSARAETSLAFAAAASMGVGPRGQSVCPPAR
ncbi:hypothetical protein RHOFW104R3_28105 [Rhodanobacter denitrificans]|nr:hypothetical protein RHOFW104R3_28105 [Rhodanobacter denitrificans]